MAQMAREAGLLSFAAAELVPEPDDVPGVLAALDALTQREAGDRAAVLDIVARCGVIRISTKESQPLSEQLVQIELLS